MTTVFYANDNEGRYPAAYIADLQTGAMLSNIVHEITPYFRPTDAWTDPSQYHLPRIQGGGDITDGLVESAGFLWPVNYAFNRYMYPGVEAPYPHPDKLLTFKHVQEDKIEAPLETIAVFCFHPPMLGWGMFLRCADVNNIRLNTFDYDPAHIHRTQVNTIFADSHYEPMEADYLSAFPVHGEKVFSLQSD